MHMRLRSEEALMRSYDYLGPAAAARSGPAIFLPAYYSFIRRQNTKHEKYQLNTRMKGLRCWYIRSLSYSLSLSLFLFLVLAAWLSLSLAIALDLALALALALRSCLSPSLS